MIDRVFKSRVSEVALKNGLNASWTRLFFIFAIFDDFSKVEYTEGVAEFWKMAKFWLKMKKILVQLAFLKPISRIDFWSQKLDFRDTPIHHSDSQIQSFPKWQTHFSTYLEPIWAVCNSGKEVICENASEKLVGWHPIVLQNVFTFRAIRADKSMVVSWVEFPDKRPIFQIDGVISSHLLSTKINSNFLEIP